jgi:hypothetical protein
VIKAAANTLCVQKNLALLAQALLLTAEAIISEGLLSSLILRAGGEEKNTK